MARTFNGSTDTLATSVGGASGYAFGTTAAIVYVNAVTKDHAIAHQHNSGGTWVSTALMINSASKWAMHNGTVVSVTTFTVTTGRWFLCVGRKATGTVAPRFSVYDYTAGSWTHGAGDTTMANLATPGAGGTVQTSFQSATDDQFNGDIAVRALWSGVLPWTADTTGDTAIVDSGLQHSLSAWLNAAPTVLHLLDQSAVGQKVVDLTGGGANESAITGTSVSSRSQPSFTYGFDVLVPQSIVAAAAAANPPESIISQYAGFF